VRQLEHSDRSGNPSDGPGKENLHIGRSRNNAAINVTLRGESVEFRKIGKSGNLCFDDVMGDEMLLPWEA
jgi:hypothetical protein